jgi:cell division protein FtsW
MGNPGVSKNRIDLMILLPVVMLLVIGLMMVYSATFVLGNDLFYYLKWQLLWVAAGATALAVISRIDYRRWRTFALPIMAAAVALLIVVLAVGHRVGNAQSWLLQGRVQPSEFAKLAFIIYIAAWLASRGDQIRDVTYGLIPFSILLGAVTALIVLQPDLGAAVLVVVTAVSMFFIAGAEISQLAVGLFAGIPTLLGIVATWDYARTRILTFLHPESDVQGAGYQVHAILTALRTGGLVGRGLGAGTQKFIEPWVHHTDTIFAVIGEELGLIGCLIVIGLFTLFAYRGLLTAFRAPDTFGMLLALGITCWILVQTLVHMAVNTATLPFTGLTLPFISYGGSSLVTCMAGVGILLSISRASVQKERKSVAAFAFGWRNRRPRLSSTRRRRGME